MQQCIEMVNELSPRIPPIENHNEDFENHQERWHIAVSMTLPSCAVKNPAALLVALINHHGSYTIAKERAADIDIF